MIENIVLLAFMAAIAVCVLIGAWKGEQRIRKHLRREEDKRDDQG